MRAVIAVGCCLLLVGAIGGVAAAQSSDRGFVRGSPDLIVETTDNEVGVGESTVELRLLNRGGIDAGGSTNTRVTTARAVVVSAGGSGPVTVETDRATAGAVRTESSVPVPLRVSVPVDAEPGSYDLEVDVTYTYTETIAPRSNVVSQETETETFEVTVVVPEGPRFVVADADTDAQVGGEGTLSVTLRNEGTEVARDASVGVQSATSGAVIGEGNARSFAGALEPGETTTLEYDTTVTAPGEFPAEATVGYEGEDGLTESSRTLSFGVDPAAEQSFGVNDVETSLSVGATGEVTGTVTNEGPEPVDDAVLVVSSNSQRLDLGEGEYALSTLEAGESEQFSFEAEVSGQADPAPRQLDFTVEYTSGGVEATSDRLPARIDIQQRQPVFEIDAAETLSAGGSTTLAVEIQNNRPETLTDITANLYADSPLSAGTDESFVDELEPGESATVEFELSVAGGAMPNTYAVEMDFQYTDVRGDERISDVYQEPIEVTASESDGDGSLSPLVVAVAAGIVVFGFDRRRR